MRKIELLAMVLAVAGLAAQARAEEMDALPGLWKTTVQMAGHTAPQVRWHCVSEDADPWVAFAQLPVTPHESCQRKNFIRTSTSLQWTLACSGDFEATSRGSIVFDSPQHYRGSIKMTGSLMGYPIDDEISLEGEHKAACTSPQD